MAYICANVAYAKLPYLTVDVILVPVNTPLCHTHDHYLQSYNYSLCSTNGLEEHEALGVASIVSQLVLFFPLRLFTSLPLELLTSLFHNLATLTTTFCHAAAKEEAVSVSTYVLPRRASMLYS